MATAPEENLKNQTDIGSVDELLDIQCMFHGDTLDIGVPIIDNDALLDIQRYVLRRHPGSWRAHHRFWKFRT